MDEYRHSNIGYLEVRHISSRCLSIGTYFATYVSATGHRVSNKIDMSFFSKPVNVFYFPLFPGTELKVFSWIKQTYGPLFLLDSSVNSYCDGVAEICQATDAEWVEIRRSPLSHRHGKRDPMGLI